MSVILIPVNLTNLFANCSQAIRVVNASKMIAAKVGPLFQTFVQTMPTISGVATQEIVVLRRAVSL